MAETCPNGEYFSVTLQQCMTRSSLKDYLTTLRDANRLSLLQAEHDNLPVDVWSALIGEIGQGSGGILGDDPLGIKAAGARLSKSLASIIVVIVGLALVGLAVNAWLNEQGTGVKVPVKLK